jgi:hypothetical protein
MRISPIIPAVCATLMLSACSQRMVDFTMISSKNVDLSRAANFERGSGRIRGEDIKPIIILFPMGEPSAKEAMDNAIESVPGAVGLMDGVITSHWWYIPYVYGQFSVEVEGTPLIDPTQFQRRSDAQGARDSRVGWVRRQP